MTDIHIHESSASSSSSPPRVKTPPKTKAFPVPFFYSPSDDGTDENLLILLHGLGDTHIPFSKLGMQLKLPQTAVLALRASEQVPFLYEESYQWYQSFDDLGEMIERPNPTVGIDLLSKVVDYLVKECKWPPNRIHFFGFAQGGSMASEFGVHWWRQQLQSTKVLPASGDSMSTPPVLSALGSIISISGPLLSYPTLSTLCPTPVLVVHRPPPAEPSLPAGSLTAFKKAYHSVSQVKLSAKGAGMPSSKEEWEPIMRFWSEKLGRRQVEGLYEVISGLST
ncbi:hypothetical protein BDQ12DRAFT_618622 [Crucibulum laeve]|uniref:Phospholipase/carboxylesterase/thioesterase domain-containing protein n=1 Tax=Crucibulum laeve TaxID=68775 RepID=A0A5C3LEP2_9AGAR|nr:hypothetical protein BDQ12DRAFT_618622 [Crucibulum laeve]